MIMEAKGLRRTVFTYKMDGGGFVAVWYRSLGDPHCAFRRLTVWSRSRVISARKICAHMVSSGPRMMVRSSHLYWK